MTALELIKSFEGCRLTAYQDLRGVWTIGWGHTGPEVVSGLQWTQEQADAQLQKDVGRTQHILEAMLEVPVSENEKAAMVSWAYNLGLHAFERSALRAKVNAGDIEGAALEFPKWCYAAGRVVPGLLRRRMEEKVVFETPDEPEKENEPDSCSGVPA